MEIGLPSWHQLASELIADVEAEYGLNLDSAKADLAADRIPAALGKAQRTAEAGHGGVREFIDSRVGVKTADTGRHGTVYELLAQMPVHFFLTTNYDSAFERHLRECGIPVSSHTNTKESLELVDPATYDVSVVHVHGSNLAGGTLVLTDSDYQRIEQAAEFRPIREFIQAKFLDGPVVIVGYRLADTDLRMLAREAAKIIRRKHPVIAVLAEADEDAVNDFAIQYNVDVIRYDSHHGHVELASLLRTTAKWLTVPQVSAAANPQDLQLSQVLYMKSATDEAGEPLRIAATKSLILAALANQGRALASEELQDEIRLISGYGGGASEITQATAACVSEGLCVNLDDVVQITEHGLKALSVSAAKYRRLWDTLSDHVQFRVGGEHPLGPLLENVLTELFSKRAAEAVSLALQDQPVDTSSISLFELVSAPAEAIADLPTRLAFVDYVIDMLRAPNTTQKAVIEHLGRSLFCVHALRLDVDSVELARAFVSRRVLIVDSNLLISLLACDSPEHDQTVSLLRSALAAGVRLVSTWGFVQETLKHAAWARWFASEHEGDDATMLAAARGFGLWDGNDFLSGLIRRANISGVKLKMASYLEQCLGALEPTVESAAARLQADWNISFLSSRQCAQCSPQFYEIRDRTDEYIAEHAPGGKTGTRVHTESEAYAVIHEWGSIGKSLGMLGEAYALSAGGYLNRVASEGPHPIGRSVVVTPYALAGFLDAYINPNAVHDFASVVRSEYFNCASDYLEEADLEKYFSAVIASADRAYEAELRPRLLEMEEGLAPSDIPGDLSDIPPIDRPEVVRGIAALIGGIRDKEEEARLFKEKQAAESRAQEAEERAKRAEELLDKRRRGQARYDRAEERRKGEQ